MKQDGTSIKDSESKVNSKEKNQGDDAMGSSIMNYAGLNLSSLGEKNVQFITSDDALKDIVPIQWEDDILQGKKKISIAEKRKEE